MTAIQLIELLRGRGLISGEDASALRLTAAGDEPHALVNRLVGDGLLTAKQAAVLHATELAPPADEEDVLDLAPLDLEIDGDDSSSVFSESDVNISSAALFEEPDDFSRQEEGREEVIGVGSGSIREQLAGRPAEDSLVAKELIPTSTTLDNLGKRKKSAKGRRNHVWDSPLMLYGGGSVAVLAGAIALLYFLIFRENADAVLKRANDLFKAGAYAQARDQYGIFVEKYSAHQDYSLAKVRLAMTELWELAEQPSRAGEAVAAATRILPTIENEPAFISGGGDAGEGLSESKREASVLLTRIAKELATQAADEDKGAAADERLQQIDQVLSLTANTKYVPERYRLDGELDQVRATLDQIQRRRRRAVDLTAALSRMDAAIAAGRPIEALAIRGETIRAYPNLEGDAQLEAKIREAAAAEAKQVKFVQDERAAATAEDPVAIVAELTLVDRRQPLRAGAAGRPVVFRVDGGLYALGAATGQLLWRRTVEGDSAPLATPSGDVFVADNGARQLICLGEGGKLRWRLPLDDELVRPILVGDRLVVSGASGKLYVINAKSGALVGHVAFSQPLTTPPCVNERGDRIYVVGAAAHLYTISAEDFSCLGVYPLGHQAGGVAAAPIYAVNKVIVAENIGLGASQVRALSLDDRSAVKTQEASHRLRGLVTTQLSVEGRRFAAVTSLGEATVFEAGAGVGKAALSVIASRESRRDDHLGEFMLLAEGDLWLGGNGLAKLKILPTENKLAPTSLDQDFPGDVFDAPLQAVDRFVLGLRRPARAAGAVVFAVEASDGRLEWETTVAVPTAGAPAADPAGMRLAVATASGTAHVLDRAALGRRMSDEAKHAVGMPQKFSPVAASADLGGGRLAAGAVGSPALLLLRPNELQDPLLAVPLPAPLACPPVAWLGNVAAATKGGQVFLLDAESGAEQATPFQPPLVPGREYSWLRPAVVSAGDAEALAISDGVDKIYLLHVASAPAPHLEQAASADVGPAKLVTPLAASATRVFAGSETGELISFLLPKLERQPPLDLGGRASWGPYSAGHGILLATDADELLMVDDDGAVAWRQKLEQGTPIGDPLIDGKDLLVALTRGGILRLASASGEIFGRADAARPLVSGPVAFGGRFVIAAADGSLIVVNRP